MTRKQMIEKAKAICEESYKRARECEELGLKRAERAEVSRWIAQAEAFAKLFEIPEDELLGL